MWQFTPAAILYILSAGTSFLLSYLAWRMRAVRGVRYFSFFAFSGGLWSVGYLLEFFTTDPDLKLIMLRVEYLGIISTSLFWFLFAATYTQTDRWLNRKTLALLLIVPTITFFFQLTFEQNHIFYRSHEFITEDGMMVFRKVYGPGFYMWFVYGYSLTLAGMFILIRRIVRMPEQFRGQGRLIVMAVVVMLFVNTSYVTGNNPLPPYDPTSFAFVFAGVLFMIAMQRYRFLDVIPVAHSLILKTIHNGIIIIDNREQILEMNPAAERMLNCALQTVLGQPVHMVFPNNLSMLGDLLGGQKVSLEQGTSSYELQMTPLTDASATRPVGKIIMLSDMTERRAMEQSRLELALERERMQILADFITQASHEFRTPLSILRTDTHLLTQLGASEKQQRYIDSIDEQATSITNLVNSLTLMAKLDSLTELIKEAVDLCEFVKTQVQDNPSLVLELVDCPLQIAVDGYYLQRAISAIVDNAIRFTPEDGKICVRVERDDTNAVISVTDSGVGIHANELAYIFKSFYRSDKVGTTRGFGLGLPIANAIVTLHGGIIEVESELGKGSTFRIVLPIVMEP